MPARRLRQPQALSVAVDTGGTFTDCVWREPGGLRLLKVFSTPQDPSLAITRALKKIAGPGNLILLHGTTVGTNTLLERKGARVAFVTTAGFEDSIEIGRQARPRLYDLFFERVPPLVPARLRFGAAERVGPRGEILQPLSAAELTRLVARVARARPQSIAISLLFSFANPEHEIRIARRLARLGVPLSLSHQILPEFREYERASTVVVNAYLQPVMGRYLEGLRQRIRRTAPAAKIFVMQSSGGIASLAFAARQPARTLLSGPAGGVVGAAAMARLSGCRRIIAFDMGGTSTDVSLVSGAPQATGEGEVAGLPVRLPMLEIHTVGAGGGSLVRFDAAGALRVGPESAGASPGPICYGRGHEPTVTDANLLLGRLPRLLGGEFMLDAARTRATVRRWLRARHSAFTPEQLAAGVVRVVNANMEKALRVVSVERGYDPREFTLVAFGGAGALHACELAQGLGIPQVLVPAMPGALSAYGILVSDVVKNYSRTVQWRVPGSRLPPQMKHELAREFTAFERQARAEFHAEGWPPPQRLAPSADLRYRGQGYELNVPLANPGFLAAFHRQHQRRYGYSQPEREVEIVTLRLCASLPQARARRTDAQPFPRVSPPAASPAERGRAIFNGKAQQVAIHERSALARLKKYSGPAIVCEYSATTAVPPGMRFWIDRAGNLIVRGAG